VCRTKNEYPTCAASTKRLSTTASRRIHITVCHSS
jgi:hypothetical protein